MLRAVIFDDEYIVIQGLKKMIDWSRYGIEVVGTASDGHSALSLFKSLKPDIIFTDIRMPGMDGLELIHEVMKESPETICIVFSGFNEFDYVKKAIKLGVADYLEKPVTIPMVEEAIERTLKKINEQNEMTKLKQEQENTYQELVEKVTLDLLLNRPGAKKRWSAILGVDSKVVVGVTVIAYSNKAPLILDNQTTFRIVSVWNGLQQLLVVFHLSSDTDLLWKEVEMWSELTGGHVGSGQTWSNIDAVPKSYSEAVKALNYGHFIEEEGWVRFEDIPSDYMIPEELSDKEKAIISNMRKGDKVGLSEKLDQYIHWIESERFDRDVAEREILKLIYLGMEVIKEIAGDKLSNWRATYLPHMDIREMTTREEMTRWLRRQIDMMMDHSTKSLDTSHSAIKKAHSYIQEHFGKDLTLQEVAEYVDMNPTYFSYLFKEETGESYIKYLTRFRIEQAKLLLDDGGKVADVSEEVGYQTYRHFSEVFKKQTGMTPSQYKSL